MPKSDGPKNLVQMVFYTCVVMAGALGLVNLCLRQDSLPSLVRSIQVQFVFTALVIFFVSFIGFLRRTKTYGPWPFCLDVLEVILIAVCLREFGTLEGVEKDATPSVGWGVFWIGVIVFSQVFWRRAVGLRNCAEHYDFRFLVIALLGFAYVLPIWWARWILLTLAVVLAGIYWSFTWDEDNDTPCAVFYAAPPT